MLVGLLTLPTIEITFMIIIIRTAHTVLLEYCADEKPLRMSQISRKIELCSGKDRVYLPILI